MSVPLGRLAVGAARRSAPGLVRAAVRPEARSAMLAAAARRLLAAPLAVGPRRHPLTPAAIRVERSRGRRGDVSLEHTAVTLWFGEGPALPAERMGGSSLRTLVRLAAGLAGAAALAAAGSVAARLGTPPARVIDSPARALDEAPPGGVRS